MELIKQINDLRLANKDKWYQYVGYYDGKYIEIKGYNTWLQVFRVNGIQQITTMDCSVKDFKHTLAKGIL